MGAYVRTTARNSMRYRKKASAPGTPPSAHRKDDRHPRGPLLKQRIFYAFDPFRRSVVIGPELLPGSKHNVPFIQEFGGFATIRRRSEPAKKRSLSTLSPAAQAAFIAQCKAGKIVRPKAVYTEVVVALDPRPTTGPALERSLPYFPTLYGDQIQP